MADSEPHPQVCFARRALINEELLGEYHPAYLPSVLVQILLVEPAIFMCDLFVNLDNVRFVIKDQIFTDIQSGSRPDGSEALFDLILPGFGKVCHKTEWVFECFVIDDNSCSGS